MENSNTIGSRIKSLRQSMKLNQIEFAKTLGIKQSTLSSYLVTYCLLLLKITIFH